MRDDQNIAGGFCFAQKMHMAAMQKIETAIGEDHCLTRSPRACAAIACNFFEALQLPARVFR